MTRIDMDSLLIRYHVSVEFLVVLSFASFLLDVQTNPCIQDKKYTSVNVFAILFVHHVLNVFVNFGWLLNDVNLLKLYVMTPVIVALHWATNDNKCIVTQWVNRMCGNPDTEYLHDLLYMVGFKDLKYYDPLHYSYLAIGVGLSIYKLRVLKAI